MIRSRIIEAVLASAWLVAIPAAHAASLTNSLGINVHLASLDTDYADFPDVIRKAKAIGFTHLRQQLRTDPASMKSNHAVCAAGLKWDFIIMQDPAPMWPAIRDLAAAGCIRSFEGPNEFNNVSWLKHEGLTGKQAALAIQEALYTRVKSDPTTAAVPVYSFTMSAGKDRSGLQPGGQFADYAASHPYLGNGTQPACCIMKAVREAQDWAPGKPPVVTETGYRTVSGVDPHLPSVVDEPTQARLLLNSVFDLYAAGVQDIIPYQLLDSVEDVPAFKLEQRAEAHWGLFRHVTDKSQDSWKASAHAFRRLFQTLPGGDRGSTLAYKLAAPSTTRSMALKRAAGGDYVVVWPEPRIWDDAAHARIDPPVVTATLNLPASAATVKVTNLITGAETSYSGVTEVPLSLAADPLVVTLP